MGKSTLTTAVVVLTLALASIAVAASATHATFTQVARVTLTTRTADQSTGINADISSSDPAAPGQKPKSAGQLTITFPANTKFNLNRAEACTLSDKQLTTPFGPSCPRDTQIGTGSAVANASPLAATVDANVKSYVARANQIIIEAKPSSKSLPGASPLVIRATVSGSKLTIPIPDPHLGKAPGFAGVELVIVSLTLNVPKLGTGHNALITAGRCAAHKFVVKEHFVCADRSRLDLQSISLCT
jgi:hypothetical protein